MDHVLTTLFTKIATGRHVVTEHKRAQRVIVQWDEKRTRTNIMQAIFKQIFCIFNVTKMIENVRGCHGW